jgi:aminotransferase EvaB
VHPAHKTDQIGLSQRPRSLLRGSLLNHVKKILPADPKASYLAAQAELDAAVQRVLHSGHYILGPEVELFEKEFSTWLGVTDTVGVANGTDALELALRASGIGPGDKVVTVANTVTATVAAISATGAKAVFVDVEPETLLMDVAALEQMLATLRDPKIKAVLPVHLYGLAVDMPRLMEVAAAHNLVVIEDCAQAHGATVGGRKTGTWGRLSAFSFYPTKNLGALGDGGAVCGSDAALIEQVRLLRQYGWRKRYVSELHGRNSRLDEMQAAILRVRLERLDAENARRAEIAARYINGLSGTPLTLPGQAKGRTPCWHQFAVRTPRRDELRTHLEKRHILCGVLYPVPVHRQPAYHDASLSFPHTEQACAEVLSLPLHPGLHDDDVDRVIREVTAFFNPSKSPDGE